MEEIKEFLQWLEKERYDVAEACDKLGVNGQMVDQHYDKIIRKYRGTVYGQAMCNQFKASQN